MTTGALGSEKVDELRRSFRGTLLQAGDDGYEGARRIWNGSR
jgi:hypothetical protein